MPKRKRWSNSWARITWNSHPVNKSNNQTNGAPTSNDELFFPCCCLDGAHAYTYIHIAYCLRMTYERFVFCIPCKTWCMQEVKHQHLETPSINCSTNGILDMFQDCRIDSIKAVEELATISRIGILACIIVNDAVWMIFCQSQMFVTHKWCKPYAWLHHSNLTVYTV